MKNTKLIFKSIILITFLSYYGCENYVTGIDPLIDKVEDSVLDTEERVPFLIAGVQNLFAHSIDNVLVLADGMSDQLIFDENIPGASYIDFGYIDVLNIQGDNWYISVTEERLHEIRLHGKKLVERANNINFEDIDLKNEALFVGYFYDGYARFCLATYFGLEPTVGGHAIDGGPFMPSTELYATAIEKFNEAKTYAPNDYWIRLINSIIAKTHLFDENYSAVLDALQQGLNNQDDSFKAEYLAGESSNYYCTSAGNERTQWTMDDRFKDYIAADSSEVARIPYDIIWANNNKYYRFFQVKYPVEISPIILMSWQEVALMKAEVALRGFGSDDARSLINDVRTSHGIANISGDISLATIAEERDKELFCQGNRLPDQRRFDQWHGEPGSWQYFTISDIERTLNPNIGFNF